MSWRTPIDEKELADLWQLLVGSMTGGSDALTPDGNLTLIDDIGSNTKAGKQFITLEGKKGITKGMVVGAAMGRKGKREYLCNHCGKRYSVRN